MMLLFNLQAVGVRFGGVSALTDCHLHINSGELLALIGSNGSGKTSMLRVLYGLLKPTTGQITADIYRRMIFLTVSCLLPLQILKGELG